MQNPIKRYATILVLAATSVSLVPMAAMADRASDRGSKVTVEKTVEKTTVIKKVQSRNTKVQNTKSQQSSKKNVKVQRKTSQKKSVGHRFQQREVVVVNDWSARGLRRPNKDEVYIVNGDDIYLAAAATLIVKALIN